MNFAVALVTIFSAIFFGAILPSHSWAASLGRVWSLSNTEYPRLGPKELATQLKAIKVKPSLKNRWIQGDLRHCGKFIQCNPFRGSHSGNTIVLKAEGRGGSGKYKHHLVYTLNGFSQGHDPSGKQIHTIRNGNGHFAIKLPELKDKVSFVQLTASLITEDRNDPNLSALDQITFLVSRPVILSRSTAPALLAQECFERYLPQESDLGLISNGTSTPSTLKISHGFQKSWSSAHGWQAGVYFSPIAYAGYGNPIFGNIGYFRQTVKQTIETMNTTTSHQIPPGAFMQVFVQPTRYIQAYDATLVDPCGETRKQEGAYFFQNWRYSYILYPVNPSGPAAPELDKIGAPAINTCSEALNILPDGQTSGHLQFLSTEI